MNRAVRLCIAAAALAVIAIPADFSLRPLVFGTRVTAFVVSRGDVVPTVVASGRAETSQGVDVGSQIIDTVRSTRSRVPPF